MKRNELLGGRKQDKRIRAALEERKYVRALALCACSRSQTVSVARRPRRRRENLRTPKYCATERYQRCPKRKDESIDMSSTRLSNTQCERDGCCGSARTSKPRPICSMQASPNLQQGKHCDVASVLIHRLLELQRPFTACQREQAHAASRKSRTARCEAPSGPCMNYSLPSRAFFRSRKNAH